jgi:uncharacterized protein with HEPN domain
VSLYLGDIVEASDRVASYIEGLTFEAFVADNRTVDAVVRNLEIVGEAAKKVPSSMRSRAEQVPWREMAGLRDVVAHAYFGIDHNIIWDVASNHLPQLRVDVAGLLLAVELE